MFLVLSLQISTHSNLPRYVIEYAIRQRIEMSMNGKFLHETPAVSKIILGNHLWIAFV